MNKTLKFPKHFVEAILASDTGATTRLFDEKNLSVGDELSFIEKETGRCFANARITKVVEAPFEEVMKYAADMKGMYEQYADYHKTPIEPSTPMKVISYEITARMPSPESRNAS